MIGAFHQYRTRPIENHFAFGWEMGRVARSIATGQGFSNPYGVNTGPTAWEPPLYPYLMAGVFRLFGIYTYGSAWILLSINSLFASLTTIPIFLIARKTFGERVARWSAWGWALNPYIWYWSIHWIWDTTFTPLILSLIFSGSSGTPGMAGLPRLDDVRSSVGRRRVGESLDAGLLAVLRTLDMVAEIQERVAFLCWRRVVVRGFLFSAFARGLSGIMKSSDTLFSCATISAFSFAWAIGRARREC